MEKTEMTPLQQAFLAYIKKIAYIDGLLYAMIYRVAENDEEGIMHCIEDLHRYDPEQAYEFKTLLEKK